MRQSSGASSQRGWKKQPSGRLPGSGAWPGMPTTVRWPARSGTARSSRRVYGCRGALKMRSRGAALDDPPGVHDRDAVGELGDDREVVAHVQRRDLVAAAQVADGLEHARLRRDVEAGRRLVAHDHARAVGERHRDRDALLLAARELVRVALEERVVARQRDLLERLAQARGALLRGHRGRVRLEHLGQLHARCRSAGFSDVPGSCGM